MGKKPTYEELEQRIEELEKEASESRRVKRVLAERTHDLGERVKELNCLHGISRLVEKQHISLEEILQGIVDLVPPAWQYPEITCARILLEGQEYRTENFGQTIWKQDSHVIVMGDHIGTLEVYYLEERPERNEGPFLREERRLLNDIAEQVGRIIKLRRTEQAYRALVEQSIQGLVVVQDYRIVFANIAFADIWGYNIEELYSLSSEQVRELVHPADQGILWGRFRDRLEGKEIPPRYEYRGVDKDGTVRWLEMFASRIEYHGKPAVQGAIVDITDRKRAEEELRRAHDESEQRVQERTAELAQANRQLMQEIEEHKRTEETLRKSEKRFRDLVENSLTSVSIIQDNRIVYQNPEHQRLLGVSPQSVLSLDFKTIHPDDASKVKRVYQELLSGKARTVDMDFRFYPLGKMNGRPDMKWLYCRGSSIEYQGKESILVNMMDMTRAKELEQLVRIQDKMTSLGRVAAGIAHEIRNPLSGVNIYLNTLEKIYDKRQNLDKIKGILTRLQSASNKMESVIKRVIDFSKPSEPQLVLTDINHPIEEALALASVTLRKSRIKIAKSLAGDLPRCHADPPLIEEVILNLMNNAAEAMKGMEGKKIIEIRSFVEHERILVAVSDSGPGVPMNLRDKIFDPFYTTKTGSTGIGLSLCQRIITDHSGSLRVSASKWGGAEFTIEIPIEKRTTQR